MNSTNRLSFRCLIAFATALLPPCLSAAQEETSSPFLTLREAVAQAVENNLGIRVTRFDPDISFDQVAVAESAFDIELFASANLTNRETASTFTQAQGTASDTRYYQAGARKLFETGGILTASSSLSRSDSNAGINLTNLEYRSDFSVEMRQPLLRGAWKAVNLAAVAKAKSAYAGARYLFQNDVAFLVEQTELAYWNLAYARSRRDLQESIRKAAADLVAESKERERVGLATKVEVLQAEAALAAREEAIILAEQSIAEAEDALGRLLGMLQATDDAAMHALNIRVASMLPEPPEVPNFVSVWTNALSWNPSIAAQEEAIYRTDIDRIVAKNQLLPQVDLTAGASLLGNDTQRARTAVGNAVDRDGDEWRVGLEVTYPWGRSGAKAMVRIAERTAEREKVRLQEVKSLLYQEVRSAWRELANGPARLKAADASVALQQQNYEQMRARYQSGLATLREVIEAQGDLDSASLSRLEALLAILQAHARLGRLDGSGLTRNGLVWDETAPLLTEF